MAGILPKGIPQLMLLCSAITFISYIRKILFPVLCVFASVYLAMDIFSLYHKNAVTGYDDMVDLSGIITALDKHVVEYHIVVRRQFVQP